MYFDCDIFVQGKIIILSKKYPNEHLLNILGLSS
jgi:hypothetical protein